MPLPTAQLVRQRIQDPLRREDATYYGDGTANVYGLPHVNLQSGSAWIAPAGNAWVTTGATFDPTGFVTFANSVSANSAFRVVYVHSIFGDDVIAEYISANGSVLGAALQCAYDLQFDNVKRSRWMAANGAQFDNMQAGAYVDKIIAAIKEEMMEEAINYGQVNSWSETQGE